MSKLMELNSQSPTFIYKKYVEDNWVDGSINAALPDYRGLAIMSTGLAGEIGEFMEHFKKVVRNHDGNFDDYPKRQEALLEAGDALYYFVRMLQEWGFTLEQVMAANMDKLDHRRRYGKSSEGCTGL